MISCANYGAELPDWQLKLYGFVFESFHVFTVKREMFSVTLNKGSTDSSGLKKHFLMVWDGAPSSGVWAEVL